MPVKFDIDRSELSVEGHYSGVQFGLFRSESELPARLLARLSEYGLGLAGMKMERGTGTFAETHLQCYLLDYAVTVRIRVDRLEIHCSYLTEENKERVIAAGVATLDCVRQIIGADYRTYTVGMHIHGLLEHQDTKSFLGKLVNAPPPDAGAVTGNGVAYYFAPVAERIVSSLTLDVSTVTTGGLYARPQAIWDASRLPLERLPEQMEHFVRHALGAFDVEVP